MMTRRSLLLLSAATALVAPFTGFAQGAAGADTQFIIGLGNAMTAIVNGPGAEGDKVRQLRPLIMQAVDFDDIGRFCLGRYWRVATPQQQQQYMQLFREVVINNIGGRLGQYRGVTFAPTQTTERDGNAYVGTVINRPNQQPANVQWVVSNASGRPQIVDVVAEGTSLRLTQRADYAAYLSRNGDNVSALLTAMQRQTSAGPG